MGSHSRSRAEGLVAGIVGDSVCARCGSTCGIISELSQYPHEAEILFRPLPGIEVKGHSVNDGRVVLDTRLSRNLMSETIEQVLQRRHKMIREHCDSVVLELLQKSGRLAPGPASELARAAFRCGPLTHEADWFNDDNHVLHTVKAIKDINTDASILVPFSCLSVTVCWPSLLLVPRAWNIRL